MARYSEKKPIYCEHLVRAFHYIESAAKGATQSDLSAVRFAAIAAKFAAQWTEDTTEASRRECLSAANLLQDNANHSTTSKLSLAFLAYAKCLKAFVACDYNESMRFADMSTRIIDR